MTFNNVKVKAGWDETLTSTENIETFTPNVGSPQRWKLGQGGMVYFGVVEREYSEGQPRNDISTAESFSGFETVIYVQPGCHPDAFAWLIANYRGQVTCSIPRFGTTYETFNAYLRFEARRKDDGWYSVRWIFTLHEVIP